MQIQKHRVSTDVNLHNEFTLVLKDAETGQIKQKAYAKNIILDQGLEKLVDRFETQNTPTSYRFMAGAQYDSEQAWATRIHLGEGSGTLEPTRTQLFSYLDFKQFLDEASAYDRGYNIEEMTAYRTVRARWPVDELQNENITEVGLGYSTVGGLVTHAIIEDAEGNPIVVEKGETDILTVYATVYIELSHSEDPEELQFVLAEWPWDTDDWEIYHDHEDIGPGNYFLNMVYAGMGTSDARPYRINVGSDRADFNERRFFYSRGNIDTLEFHDDGDGAQYDLSEEDALNPTITYDYINHKIVFEQMRFNPNTANRPSGIKEVIFLMNRGPAEGDHADLTVSAQPVFRYILPLTGVWDQWSIEDEEVGTGDGSETEFNLDWNYPIEHSEEIKVDGQLVDNYTLHHGVGTKEDGKSNILHHSQILFMDRQGREPHDHPGLPNRGLVYYNTIHRLTVESSSASVFATGDYDNGVYDLPLVFEFDSEKEHSAEEFHLIQHDTFTRSQVGDFSLEGSNDRQTWDTLVDDTPGSDTDLQVFSFDGGEQSYRYWRLTIFSNLSTGTDNYDLRIAYIGIPSTTPHIVFDAAPAPDDSIVAGYDLDYVPKDENYIIDFGFTLSFSDANA